MPARGLSCWTCFVVFSHGEGANASSGTLYAKLGRTKLSSSEERGEPVSEGAEGYSAWARTLTAIVKGCRAVEIEGCRGECEMTSAVLCVVRGQSGDGGDRVRGAGSARGRGREEEGCATRYQSICECLERRHRLVRVPPGLRPAPRPSSAHGQRRQSGHSSPALGPLLSAAALLSSPCVNAVDTPFAVLCVAVSPHSVPCRETPAIRPLP